MSDGSHLPRRVYRLRMLGMGLSAIGLAQVLVEQSAGPLLWVFWVFTGVLWPQIAIQLALRSRSPYLAELRNLLIDSALAGLWVPLIHFNLLPSALLITLATVDKINTGIRGLWWRSVPGMLLGLLVAAVGTGFEFEPESSTAVILAWLPMLLIHSTAVSLVSYRLIRKVQQQNRLLDELTRTDTLTGLQSRRHWQDMAGLLLSRAKEDGAACNLVLIDIDDFKQINDRFGHAAGDEVLRATALAVRELMQEGDHAGRLGGDEIAVVLSRDPATATTFAERLHQRMAALRFAEWPGLHITLSVGIAPALDAYVGLHEWLEAADRQMYRAKREGKNRTAIA
ncbi:MAG: diguanylate cyclase [Lysobacteraceae bacterium]